MKAKSAALQGEKTTLIVYFAFFMLMIYSPLMSQALMKNENDLLFNYIFISSNKIGIDFHYLMPLDSRVNECVEIYVT